MTIDLQEYKKPWIDLCEKRGTNPSDAFRQIVAKLTSQGQGDVVHEIAEGEAEQGSVKKKITLTASEAVLAEATAAKEGFSLTKWIVALVRARLTRQAQFGQYELELLARSNMQLLAIGRNLNQMARALNASPFDRSIYKVQLIEELEDHIKAHTKTVSNVMAANAERWRIK